MKVTTEQPRLKQDYLQTLLGKLQQEFAIKNAMAVPRLEKIVLNIGCGEASKDAKALETAQKTLAAITGQKPIVTRARKSVSNFKIREGEPIGCKVTLRRTRMYEFLERFIHVVAPRIRDFRGFSTRGFDDQGNYTFGLTEQYIFPEIDPDKMQHTFGMNITIVTTAKNKEQSKALLDGFGFPFAKPKQQAQAAQ